LAAFYFSKRRHRFKLGPSTSSIRVVVTAPCEYMQNVLFEAWQIDQSIPLIFV